MNRGLSSLRANRRLPLAAYGKYLVKVTLNWRSGDSRHSLFLIALGAILRFAVHMSTKGFNLHTIGIISMVVGAIGAVISLLWMTMWADRRRRVVPPDVPDYRRGA